MRYQVLSLLLLTTLIGVSVQQCTIEGFEVVAIEQLFIARASEGITDPSDLIINETHYNCLATNEMIGNYTFMSVSLFYTTTSNLDVLRDVRLDLQCFNGAWNRQADNNTGSRNVMRRDCYQCTANSVDYCSPCDSSCTGLNQCYGPRADQCCSYNDGDNCVADCGMNREGNATFQCVCSNFWTGDDCDSCSLVCENEGTPTSDCSVCDCVPGYEGLNCSVNTDDCSPNPCLNGGNCTDDIDSYNCTCAVGYTGTNCTDDIDDCIPNPCQHGGNCNDAGPSSYNCICAEGYTGTNCTEDIDDCSPNPCQNGGNCNDAGPSSYNCTCAVGFTGTNCTEDIDDCSPNPCQNGGNCNDAGPNSYTCTCAEGSGFTGINCTSDINDCSPNPCRNGGYCVDTGPKSYKCICIEGYNGTNCENDIDKCFPNPCQYGGSCINGVDTYACDCVLGYTGSDCETNINDCASGPCQNGGNCTDGINAYSCTCVAGYSGTDCENDIDPCSPNPCKNGGRCTKLQNDYNCTCDSVYSGRNCSVCAIPNCEECRESSENVTGECTKCVGVFVLDNGTCTNNCEIPNCILCDKVDMKCEQCQEGYRESNGECSEKMADQGSADDSAGFGIILACFAGILVLIIIIVAIIFGLRWQKRFCKTDSRSLKLISPVYRKLTDEVDIHDNDTDAAEL